ncbi:MAG: phytoene/squalene synthase family protein [Gammaproteobacteria bacterium]|nr:phytoene/squalene synthase family protein [Gammaproteobacteria bacterium]MBU1656285.1 phytoene/squalene synthase family protein [Gammaproteobacteria bacterium]MBU1959850.1 phytoene/squalene synthase family protein [Gammaproteobacteria bacterium]
MNNPANDIDEGSDFQRHWLPKVSRTFALTIPLLPAPLDLAVTNAYLLCRIADTIEDDPGLDCEKKRSLHELLIAVLEGRIDGKTFSRAAHSALSLAVPSDERGLVAAAHQVTALTGTFTAVQAEAIRICVTKMCQGMAEFQKSDKSFGLRNLGELDRYCYYVAGVVGEMLTRMFCDYSPEIALRRCELEPLAVSFGQGLQMTNILKDIWEDRAGGSCWLPQDLFRKVGYDLVALDPVENRDLFNSGLRKLIAIGHGHLRNALNYSLLIPGQETGIRRFCLWAIGLAVLTLRRIHSNPHYASGRDVKVPRSSLYATIAVTNLFTHQDRTLRLLFRLCARGLPSA